MCQQRRGALTSGVVGEREGGFWITVGRPSRAIDVAPGRGKKRGSGFRISRNVLQVPLLDHLGDVLFSLTPSSHRSSRAVLFWP
jgi:hypothetical protein